jgi:hypothetical protein
MVGGKRPYGTLFGVVGDIEKKADNDRVNEPSGMVPLV